MAEEMLHSETEISAMVTIRRVDNAPVCTTVSYTCVEESCPLKGSHLEQHRFDPDKQEFLVGAVIAAAAIETGYFEQSPNTRAKLKPKATA